MCHKLPLKCKSLHVWSLAQLTPSLLFLFLTACQHSQADGRMLLDACSLDLLAFWWLWLLLCGVQRHLEWRSVPVCLWECYWSEHTFCLCLARVSWDLLSIGCSVRTVPYSDSFSYLSNKPLHQLWSHNLIKLCYKLLPTLESDTFALDATSLFINSHS